MTPELHSRMLALCDMLGTWPHTPLKIMVPQASLHAGNDNGMEAKIIIPSQTKTGKPLPDHFMADILLEVAELFGGYTSWAACGGYVMAAGDLKQERVCVVDIATQNTKSTREHLETLAQHIKQAGDQETVYIRLPGGRVEFI